MKFLPDFLAISGLASLGYGLYYYDPRISFSVVGLLLIIAGICLGRGEAQEVEK